MVWSTPCKGSAASLEISKGVGAGVPQVSVKEYLLLSSYVLFVNVLLQERVRLISPEHLAQAVFSFLCKVFRRMCVKVDMSML